MSSSSSSTPQPVVIEAMEESKEIAVESNNPRLRSPQEAMTSSHEKPAFTPGPVRTGSEIMKFYPSKSNKIYTCPFCNKGFSTSQALGGHQNAHKQERDWDKKRKEMEANFPGLSFLNPYLDKPHLLLGGYSPDALSNDNHLGITLEPFKRTRIGGVYPSFSGGLTNMTVVPRMTPTRFFTGTTGTNGSSSMGLAPRPSYNNNPPVIPRNVPPPRTTIISNVYYSQKNVLTEENLISKVGNHKIVEIDDDDDDDDNDQPEEGTSKSWGIDLSLSL